MKYEASATALSNRIVGAVASGGAIRWACGPDEASDLCAWLTDIGVGCEVVEGGVVVLPVVGDMRADVRLLVESMISVPEVARGELVRPLGQM